IGGGHGLTGVRPSKEIYEWRAELPRGSCPSRPENVHPGPLRFSGALGFPHFSAESERSRCFGVRSDMTAFTSAGGGLLLFDPDQSAALVRTGAPITSRRSLGTSLVRSATLAPASSRASTLD